MTLVVAERVLDEPPERVYAFLAEIENHWRLSDPYLRLESLAPDGRGGSISVRTPWGLRRTARTSVTTAIAPRSFGGTADAGRHTRAHVIWRIEPRGEGAAVALEATVERAGMLDRVLLRLGGRWWLRRRFGAVVARLGRVLSVRARDPGVLARRHER